MMGKENREHKDSVFVDLFYEDETAKKNLLSLYNALHDTEYQDEEMIRKVRIGDVPVRCIYQSSGRKLCGIKGEGY